MYYVIEAIRWNQDRLTHVRWHQVSAEAVDEVRHAPAQVVPVLDAAAACRSAEVRVYVEGGVSQFFKMKACPEGIDAEDGAGVPLAHRLAHLPTFDLECQP